MKEEIKQWQKMGQGRKVRMKCLREKVKNKRRRRWWWQQRRQTQEMRGMVRCLSSERRKVFTVDQHSKSWGEVAVSARDEVKNTPRFEFWIKKLNRWGAKIHRENGHSRLCVCVTEPSLGLWPYIWHLCTCLWALRTFCISEVSCNSVGDAEALRVSVPLTGEFRLM